LQHARLVRHERLAEDGKWSKRTGISVAKVFNLGTVGGAKAAGLEGQVGRLRAGYKADLVIFDANSPAMLAAAEEDPVAAVVLHGSAGDVETVIVDGVVRKEGGKLVDMVVEGPIDGAQGVMSAGEKIGWKTVGQRVLESRKRLEEKIKTEEIDMEQGEDYALDLFHLNKSAMVEGLELGL